MKKLYVLVCGCVSVCARVCQRGRENAVVRVREGDRECVEEKARGSEPNF